MKPKGGDRGNTEIMFGKGKSTGKHSTRVDTGTMRLASAQPRRNESSRRPGEANPFGARRVQMETAAIRIGASPDRLLLT
jgi:hypothetical protein